MDNGKEIDDNIFCKKCNKSVDYCINADGVFYCAKCYTNLTKPIEDIVNHPSHYNNNPFKLETIEITKHYDFCIGNSLKYIFRHDQKGKPIEDLKKAIWYLNKKIEILENNNE